MERSDTDRPSSCKTKRSNPKGLAREARYNWHILLSRSEGLAYFERGETQTMSNLDDAAVYYLRQLRAGEFDAAFHGLTELDPAIVHPLIAAYRVEPSTTVRGDMLRIISAFRTPVALPLLAEAVRDRRDKEWKVALDGLVALSSLDAVSALEAVLREEKAAANPDSEFIDWVHEALMQTQDQIATESQSSEGT
jgi:hypothetical protein